MIERPGDAGGEKIPTRLIFALALAQAIAAADQPFRVAVVASRDDWRSRGLARSVANCLDRLGRLAIVNRKMADRLLGCAPEAKLVAVGRLLRADLIVRVAFEDNQARAMALDVRSGKTREVEATGELHRLPSSLARQVLARPPLNLSPEELAVVEEPLVASSQAIEALWQGDCAARPQEKAAHYRRAVTLDSRSAVARNRLGAALAACGQLEDALAQFDQAITLDHGYPSPHTNRGLVLKEMKRWKEAEAEFRKAIALGANSPGPYLGLARLLDRLGETIEAVEQLEKAAELAPSHLDALLTLADHYFESYNLRAARRVLDRVLALDPGNVEALNLRGLTLLVPREWEKAEADFRKALEVKPNDPETLANLGLALYGKGEVEEAIACEERALAADRSLAKAHLYLGRIYLNEKRHEEAVAEFQKACELQPDLSAARRGLTEARAAAARGSYGCGCLSLGGRPSLASLAFPVVALFLPHALLRLGRRRRQRM